MLLNFDQNYLITLNISSKFSNTNILNWSSWESIVEIFILYFLTAILTISYFENGLTLLVLIRLHSGTVKTTKLLFIILTISKLFNLTLFYALNYHAIYGLRGLTGGRFYLRLEPISVLICQIVHGAGYFTHILVNWLYVLIDVKRLLAMCFTGRLSHLIRRRNMIIATTVLALLAFLCGILEGFSFHVTPGATPVSGLQCIEECSHYNLSIVAAILFAFMSMLAPNLLSLLMAFSSLTGFAVGGALVCNKRFTLRVWYAIIIFILLFCLVSKITIYHFIRNIRIIQIIFIKNKSTVYCTVNKVLVYTVFCSKIHTNRTVVFNVV